MSRIHHDDPIAERVALNWHKLGAALNIASAFVGLMGFIWHCWAVTEHRKALEK